MTIVDHSPDQYLLRLKMNFAAELLQQPGARIKQVAEQVGFGDPFHFSRASKAASAWRRMPSAGCVGHRYVGKV